MNNKTPQAFTPENSLKQKLGADVDLKKIFSQERITKAQDAINEVQKSFFETAAPYVKTIVESSKKLSSETEKRRMLCSRIAEAAFAIKGQSESLGFALNAQVCQSLYSYCRETTEIGENQITVIGKHAETLQLIFRQRIEDDGGQLGRELMKTIQLLKKKLV